MVPANPRVQSLHRNIPVAAPLENCGACSRRQFLAESTLLAVSGLLLGACGDGVIGAGGGVTGPVNATVRIADHAALAVDGGIARIDVGTTPVAVVRKSATSYVAFSLICPHQGSTVGIQGNGFRCPNHLAQFNSSGTWIGGQVTSNLKSIAATLNAAGDTITLG